MMNHTFTKRFFLNLHLKLIFFAIFETFFFLLQPRGAGNGAQPKTGRGKVSMIYNFSKIDRIDIDFTRYFGYF